MNQTQNFNPANTSAAPLNAHLTRKYPLFLGLGAALWLLFLIFIRLVGPAVFTHGNPLLLVMFAAAIPMAMILIPLIALMTGVALREMLIPCVIMSFTALLIDGLAIGFTRLYGESLEQITAAAAFLLWGVGVTLVAALWLAHREMGKTR